MFDPIIKTVTLPIAPERAFQLFTTRIADWWPLATHSVLSAKGDVPVDLRFEPFEGGRLYETNAKGDTADWGKVTHWIPGLRVGFSWHPGDEPTRATQVDVTFGPADSGGTLVTLTHTEWARLGVIAETERASYDPGWEKVFVTDFADFARHQARAA